MSEFLFSEFEPISAKQWKQKIQVDLKGADYNDVLVSQSAEGIRVKPYYHKDDFQNNFSPIPGQPLDWRIAQHVFIDDEIIANKLAVNAIEGGAEAIIFTSEKVFNASTIFKDFLFNAINIYFDLKFISEDFIFYLQDYFANKNATIYYNIDIIGNLANTGNWFHNLKKDHHILREVFKKNPHKNILSVDTALYQNAGANIVQQLAYGMAHALEYLNHFDNELTSGNIQLSQPKMTFKIAIGPNYFFEIAKIRAFRKLYALLSSEFGVPNTCHIIAFPSKRNKTIYDYNVNMLRTTMESMSAAIGGANSICNLPYDVLFHKSNEFGERISRNQLLILKAESYFDLVSNPADGSYYIESLTDEIVEKSLELFKDIEANGGFLSQLKKGTIQRKIKESASKEQQLFDNGSLTLVGTNKQANISERMKDNLELYPFVKTKIRKTLITPIIESRISEKNEQTRLNHE